MAEKAMEWGPWRVERIRIGSDHRTQVSNGEHGWIAPMNCEPAMVALADRIRHLSDELACEKLAGLRAALEAVQGNLTVEEMRELDEVRDGFLAIEVADIGKEIAEERLLRLLEGENGNDDE